MDSLEDISNRKRRKSPLFFVAVTAIFLLLAAGVLSLIQGSSSEGERVFLAYASSAFGGTAASSISAEGKPIVPETPDLVFVGATGIQASTPPSTVTPQILGAIVGEVQTGVNPEVSRYIVEEGETISSIAEKFDISTKTILWANDLNSNSAVSAGKELIILPTSGTLHLVRPYDTLSEIAFWYRGDVDDIVDYNGLASAADIYAGDFLIVPDGVMPSSLPSGRLTPLANSYFIYPVPAPHRITQGLHAFNAVDFTNGVCGEPVYAAAGGSVQRAGYHNVGGNYVRILHPNGVVTYYGHLSKSTVSAGAKVFQGEIIGYTGYSGYTIPAGAAGCHVHFEVRGAGNPFSK